MTLPSGSVRLTIVLLNVASTCACPTAMFLRSRRRVRTTFFFFGHDYFVAFLRRTPTVFFGPATGAGIGAGALAANGQAAPVAQAAVRADLGETLDVERDLAAKVAFDPALQLLRDDIAQLADLRVAQILGAGVGGDARQRQHSLAVVSPIP